MNTNVGTIDRILRIAVGLTLIAAAVGFFGPAYQTVWGWIGVSESPRLRLILLDGGRLRRRRFASPVATSSRAAVL